MADFDASRAEILAEIRRTPGRRADNIVTDLLQRARELRVHARVCREVAREYRRLRLQWWGASLLTPCWAAWRSGLGGSTVDDPPVIIAIAVAATGARAGPLADPAVQRRSLIRASSTAFAAACERELALKKGPICALIGRQCGTPARAIGCRNAPRGGWARPTNRAVETLERISALRRDFSEPAPNCVFRHEPYAPGCLRGFRSRRREAGPARAGSVKWALERAGLALMFGAVEVARADSMPRRGV
jgi:hypothetical protein